jgi:hypothetical protein
MRAEKLVFSLKRLLGDHEQSTGSHQFGPAWPGQAGSALPPTYGTAMPMDNSVVYLGEVRSLHSVLVQSLLLLLVSGYCLYCCQFRQRPWNVLSSTTPPLPCHVADMSV